MTTFSVVIPLFNKADFIVDAVNSILTQDIGDLEILVIDDGSTDCGVNRLAAITDPRLKIFFQPNAGVSVARNHGISRASGEFVCFLDADDLWALDHLSTIEALISSDQSAVAWATSYSELKNTDVSGHAIGKKSQAIVPSYRLSQRDFMAAWSNYRLFCTDSICIRRSTLHTMQPCFPPGENLAEDQDLWFRLSEFGAIRFLDLKTTAFYRQNVLDSLTSAQVLEPLPAYVRMAQRAEKYSPREKLAAINLFRIHLLHVAWINCLAGRRKRVLELLLQVNPSVRMSYWTRILFCTALPTRLLAASRSLFRRLRAS